MIQFALGDMGPVCVDKRSQFFTPAWVADRMVDWIRPLLDDATRRAWTLRILEPSAGSGALVRPVRIAARGALVDAVELDPAWAAHLREEQVSRGIRADGSRSTGRCRVIEGDYLEQPPPAERYHLAITNPPFSGGEEAAHLAKMMDEAERIIAHLPARSLHGVDRHRQVWRRIGVDWWLRREARLVRRPCYRGQGGSDEIVIVDLRRAPGPCEVEWW